MITYLDKILKQFKMEQSKKEFLPVLQGVKLSKTRILTKAENRKENEIHSLCLSHRFYKVCHAMDQTYCILCPDLAREYNSDLGVSLDIGQNYPQQNKDMFLNYGGDKRFVVKGYVDTSFGTDPDDSKS